LLIVAGIDKMVTKSISMSDETYNRIREISEESGNGFSKVNELMVKRGLAYSVILEDQKNKEK